MGLIKHNFGYAGFLAGFISLFIFSECTDHTALLYLDQINSGKLKTSGIQITYPYNHSLFPPEFPSPEFYWNDTTGNPDKWNVFITNKNNEVLFSDKVEKAVWRPDSTDWQKMKETGGDKVFYFTVIESSGKEKGGNVASGRVEFGISKDSVGADVFFRAVTLPFGFAVKNVKTIEWYIGSVRGGKPRKMLDNMPVCANCHSFSGNGSLLAMDVDYGNDKGSYAVSETHDTSKLKPENIFTWSDYKREEGDPTFGLLSQISPDGKYVLSTIKDLSVFVAVDNNMAYSQLFFPIKGIIGIYNKNTKIISELAGANNRKLVQSNPSWSPDGKKIIFARTTAFISERIKKSGRALLSTTDIEEFFSGGKQFKFDLYSIDFNNGKGGNPVPVKGASGNGKSNYFAKFSPDGKWIVFCQANNFMLLRPESKLYIMPAQGGEPRLMNCNMDSMNSWHSWSPNSKWLVFSSKHKGIYTQLYLTHIDDQGNDSPPVLLENLVFEKRAANIPEFFPGKASDFKGIKDAFSHTAPSFAAFASDNILVKYYKRAWDNLQTAIKIDSNYVESYISRILLNSKLRQSNSNLDHADKIKALDLTSKLLLKDRNNIDLQLNHAMILSSKGENENALKEANSIMQKSPNNYMVYDLITSIYRKNKQYLKAFPYYEKMMAISPGNSSQIENYKAGAYISLGMNDKALAIINKLIKEHPYDYDLFVNRIAIYLGKKEFNKAKTDLDYIISNDPGNYKYFQLRANYYFQSGEKNLAISDCNKALSIITNGYSKNMEDIELLFDKAEQLNIMGNSSDALADYNKILEIFPTNYEALKQKAKIFLSMQQWYDAIATYDILIQNYPEEEEFFNNEAIAYLNLNEYDKAMKKLDKTLEVNSSNCDALFNRAKLKKILGMPKEAKIDFQQIIRLLKNKKNKGVITSQELELLKTVQSEL